MNRVGGESKGEDIIEEENDMLETLSTSTVTRTLQLVTGQTMLDHAKFQQTPHTCNRDVSLHTFQQQTLLVLVLCLTLPFLGGCGVKVEENGEKILRKARQQRPGLLCTANKQHR